MTSIIPVIGQKGRYELIAPFSTVASTLYRCGAIRTFTDIENFGQDVFKLYYEPFGIDRATYEADRSAGVVIVALLSDSYAPIYVPSSYVASIPDLSTKNYHHVVITASLGPLYEKVDLTFAMQQVGAVLSEIIGITPEVHQAVAPLTGTVSAEEHEVIEATRQAAITNRTSDYAKVVELQQKVDALEQKNLILEQIIIDNNLLP